MAGADNLKPFKPGDDPRRNKTGRPAIVKEFRDYLRNRLAEPVNQQTPDITRLDAIVAKLMEQAFKGNLKAMELALAYAYGKPIQGMELSAPGGGPLTIQSHDFTQLTNDQLKERIMQLRTIEQELTQDHDDSNGDSSTESNNTAP